MGSSRLLKPVSRQVSHSCGNTSPLSDAASNADRITALESELKKLKKWAALVDEKLEGLEV